MQDRYQKILNKHKTPQEGCQNEVKNQAEDVTKSIDPRPDIKIDHQLWVDLLTNTQAMFPEIFPTLHGLRCSGAGLAKTTNGFKLLPGENNPEEWQRVRTKYLNPIRDKLIRLFEITHMGIVTDVMPPEQFTLKNAWMTNADGTGR